MMESIGIIVTILLTCYCNFGRAQSYYGDFPQCDDDVLNASERNQCRLKVCGYDKDPNQCIRYDTGYHLALIMKTGISLMIFIIFLISVLIVKEVNESTR